MTQIYVADTPWPPLPGPRVPVSKAGLQNKKGLLAEGPL